MKWIRIFIGSYALLALLVSVCVHLSTFINTFAATHAGYLIPVLHIGIFVLFPALIPYSKREKGELRLTIDFSGIPAWAKTAFACLGAYAVVNFGLSMLLTHGEMAQIIDGQYMIRYGTEYVEVTAEEYYRHIGQVCRAFSGHWMIFYALFATRLLFPIGEPERRTAPAPVVADDRYRLPWKRLLLEFGSIGAMLFLGIVILMKNHSEFSDNHFIVVFGIVWFAMSGYHLYKTLTTPLAITFPDSTQFTVHTLIDHKTLLLSDVRIKEETADELKLRTPSGTLHLVRTIHGCQECLRRLIEQQTESTK